MAPREGSSIAKHGGVLDERLNVHGVEGLKVADLSICPDNVGCNTFSVRLFFYHTRMPSVQFIAL
jgi:alcohol oxidase